jgi:hypothetical protein
LAALFVEPEHPNRQRSNLLASAAEDNRKREFARESEHLPATMPEGIAYYRLLIRQHHAAMLAADVDKAMALRREAKCLARKLNGGDSGILADDDSAGNVLVRETAAPPETVPLWGQEGAFIIEVNGMRAAIELEGMFGFRSGFGFWPGFAVHAVDFLYPFISDTGIRSFLGIHAEPVAGLTPDAFAEKVIASHLRGELKGKLRTIAPEYRERVQQIWA